MQGVENLQPGVCVVRIDKYTIFLCQAHSVSVNARQHSAVDFSDLAKLLGLLSMIEVEKAGGY